MKTPTAQTFTNSANFVQQTTQAIEKVIVEAQKKRGEAHVALSGGSSPIPVYKALGQSDKINWNKLTFWLVDERYIPAKEDESNQRMIRESFGKRIGELKDFHVFDTKLHPNDSVKKYEKELKGGSDPLFDLVLLGLGEDGHTASLFPNIPELNESKRLAISTWAEGYNTPQRLTMTFGAILNSRAILFIIQGRKKEKILHTLLNQNTPHSKWPASFLLKHLQCSFYFLNT